MSSIGYWYQDWLGVSDRHPNVVLPKVKVKEPVSWELLDTRSLTPITLTETAEVSGPPKLDDQP